MRATVILFVVGWMFFLGCAPKLRFSITHPQQVLSDTDRLVVVQPEYTPVINGILVGSLSSGDNGFSVNCSYDSIMKNFERIARKNGANIIKVTRHDGPNQHSTCDYVTAEIYRADNPGQYEYEIEWSPLRKLTFDDFKAASMIDTSEKNIGAETMAGIKFTSNYISLFSKPKFRTHAYFSTFESWFKPSLTHNRKLLQHEQCHFDISELYRRKLQLALDTSKINVRNVESKTKDIYLQIERDYKARQRLYDNQTKHGTDSIMQQQWLVQVAQELNNTSNN